VCAPPLPALTRSLTHTLRRAHTQTEGERERERASERGRECEGREHIAAEMQQEVFRGTFSCMLPETQPERLRGREADFCCFPACFSAAPALEEEEKVFI